MEYTVLNYGPEHKDEVARLLLHMGPSTLESTKRYLEWKYEENPFIRAPLLALVRYGTEVVGMRGLFGTRWTDPKGTEVTLPHADDLVVHPAHRSRGLFLPINDHLIRMARDGGFSHVISLCGGLTTQAISLAAGWTEVGDLDRGFKPTASGRVAARSSLYRLIRPALARLKSPLRRFMSDESEPPRLPPDQQIDAVLEAVRSGSGPTVSVKREVDPAQLSKVRTVHNDGGLSPVRSTSFYNWRLSNPDRVYRILTCEESYLRGFVVLSWASATSRSIKIAEIGADDDEVIEIMLSALARIGDATFEMMVSTQPGELVRCAVRHGFLPSSDLEQPLPRRRFLYHTTGAPPPAVFDSIDPARLSSWNVSLLDTMGA